ncbi:hypothetical protein MASR2M15_06350 [Anaerolineales bacterium]
MSNDDLRNLIDFDEETEEIVEEYRSPKKKKSLLGLSAGQRAFLSVVLFLNALIIGLALLIATGRLGI